MAIINAILALKSMVDMVIALFKAWGNYKDGVKAKEQQDAIDQVKKAQTAKEKQDAIDRLAKSSF